MRRFTHFDDAMELVYCGFEAIVHFLPCVMF